MKKLFFCAISYLLTAQVSMACSCGGFPPDFMSSVRLYLQSTYASETHLNMLRVIDVKGGYGIRAQVLRKYYGNGLNEVGDTVTIWGDPGTTCRFNPVAYYLPADTFIALTVSMANHTTFAPEEHSDFYIDNCGYYHIRVTGDRVIGGGPGSFTFNGYGLAPFEDSLNNLAGTVGIGIPAQLRSAEVSVYPSPTTGMLKFEVASANDYLQTCIIRDAVGRTLIRKAFRPGDINELSIEGFAAGFYFAELHLKSGHTVIRKVEKR